MYINWKDFERVSNDILKEKLFDFYNEKMKLNWDIDSYFNLMKNANWEWNSIILNDIIKEVLTLKSVNIPGL